jgi:two-component system chemotaxis response regulator CheY
MTKLRDDLKSDMINSENNMPNMDDMGLIKKVRVLPGFRFTSIFTISTESQTEKAKKGKDRGAVGWPVKPVEDPDLFKIIKMVMPWA